MNRFARTKALIMTTKTLISAAVVCTAARLAIAKEPVITIHADQMLHTNSPYLTGACIEDVNHEIYGGIDIADNFRATTTDALNATIISQRPAAIVCRESFQRQLRCGLGKAFAKNHLAVETSLRFQLGELCMIAGEYGEAVKVYESLPRRASDEEGDVPLLANAFNYSEARRRAGQPIPTVELKEIVSLYERGAATEGVGSAVIRLNHMQAMHIPYALLGDLERSRQLLQNVQELATAVSPRERIFSVVTYTEMPADEFLQQIRQMLDALNSGKLWDGTLLPVAKRLVGALPRAKI